MIRKVYTILVILTITLTSCGSKKLYSWHNYENSSYRYIKNQSDISKQNLIESYNKVLNSQRGTRKTVPPGIYAERGYLLLRDGEIDEGIKYLEREMELYPESETFLSRIVKQIKE